MRIVIAIFSLAILLCALPTNAATTPTKPTPPKDTSSTHVQKTIKLKQGSFLVDIITLDREKYTLITDTGNTTDCTKSCTGKKLGDYVKDSGATIGIHGSYFCPPDYKDCASKLNTYQWPVLNTRTGTMINEGNIKFHEGPLLLVTADGAYKYLHRAYDLGKTRAAIETVLGSTITAAISNYPTLVETKKVVVQDDPRLDKNGRTVKGIRGAIGFNDKTVILAIARKATIVDMAHIMQSLGAEYAMNLDGGGSAAMIYNGKYKVGPGRLLPNAIVFKKK